MYSFCSQCGPMAPSCKHEEGAVTAVYVGYNCSRTDTTNGLGSSVGIATGYGMDGPGIESRWGRDFPPLFRPALGSTYPPLQWVRGLSRE